jgi:hypothetical protein
MKFLLFLSNAFINTMGITQPSPKAAQRVVWVIAFMLTAVLFCVIGAALLALHIITRH